MRKSLIKFGSLQILIPTLSLAGSLMYPNLVLTPGATDPAVTQANIATTVCKAGYTKTVRNVDSATRHKAFEEYGIPYREHASFEVDHEISLQLGGSNALANLWPEFYAPVGNNPLKTGIWGAREKDVSEGALRRCLCLGKLTLKQVQEAIVKDWIAVYRKAKSKTLCP